MFKSSAIQKTTPNPISLIPQKGFKWEIDEAKNIAIEVCLKNIQKIIVVPKRLVNVVAN